MKLEVLMACCAAGVPVTSYLGCINANSNAEVRSVLTPLADLAAKFNISILGINHLNKRQDLAFIHRGLGSTAFVAQSRAAWAVIQDKDDDEFRILCPIKCNYSVSPTGLRFRIIDNGTVFESDPWVGKIDEAGKISVKKVDEAVAWLEERLKNGAALSDTLFEEGKEEGFSRNILFRAKDKTNIRPTKNKFDGRWFWELKSE